MSEQLLAMSGNFDSDFKAYCQVEDTGELTSWRRNFL